MVKRPVIGITGSIGSGKSSAAKYLGRHGFSVINADKLYRHLYAKKGALRERLVLAFGKGILLKKGGIDRLALRRIVFNDPKKLRLLNSIAHPIILAETKKKIASSKKPVVIDAPLLLEAKFDRLCDYVIVVHAKKDIVLKRLLATRTLTRKEILSIMRTQMPFAQKKMRADFIVDTSGNYERTHEQLDLIIEALRKSNNKP
jgi:dephospho-CoA kinase